MQNISTVPKHADYVIYLAVGQGHRHLIFKSKPDEHERFVISECIFVEDVELDEQRKEVKREHNGFGRKGGRRLSHGETVGGC